MSIAGRLGAVYFTRSQQFHQAPHSGCSFLSSPLTKVTQGLQQCRPSYCIAYHSKPLDAAPWSAARGLFSEKCCILGKSRKNLDKIERDSAKIQQKSGKFCKILFKKSAKLSAFLKKKLRLENGPKRCKGVHCVDLGESFPTSIYLQNLALIQPRTSLFNFFIFSPALVI